MERRVLVAIFLSLLVLYGYQALFVKPAPKPPATQSASTSPGPENGPGPGQSAATSAPSTGGTPTQAPSAPLATAVVGDAVERDIRVETRDVIAVFTNRGARLRSWRLKRYLDPAKQPQELVDRSIPNEQLPF